MFCFGLVMINRLLVYFGKEWRSSKGRGWIAREFYRGLTTKSQCLYDRARFDTEKFVTDWERLNINVNGQYRELLDDKLTFSKVFQNDLPLVKSLGIIHESRFFPEGDSQVAGGSVEEAVRGLLERWGKVVIKAVRGHSGRSVWILESTKGNTVSINRKELEFCEVIERIQSFPGTKIVTEFVNQGGFPEALYPNSLNTIRGQNPKFC